MNSNIGVALLVVAGIAIFAAASSQSFLTNIVSAVGVLVLAAGALISGTAEEDGRPV